MSELPNLVNLFVPALRSWENVIFSLIIACVIVIFGCLASRKGKLIPGRLQNMAEIIVGGLDDFICGIMGPQGRNFTPFIGTLFIYILLMNLSGLVPFFKAPTSSWSITLGLALCVFIYVHYAGFRRLGFLGYVDMMAEKPRGFMLFSVIFPLLMFCLHLISELVRPISLSLRLRSNIWGDDLLLAVLAGFGIKGVPLLLFSSFITIIAAVVQAVVFTLLATIYFAFIIIETEEKKEIERRV